ncbi:hypothetical protein GJA_3349 [Janthinobacterium agaricidamnosum NBRC 102515 = DSM 9628]|uniref:Uncharacterized protein n=1 Tax=Janthinobacterium agaricidamnosum NBRC 102515 = DSM 9628 TaxID=1349767 RepID=W0V9F9_9BURK|nr:hypothetical protein GJA_3349 [Janthinobacterium agaricidamnosum NBRC 102515 = DSM 9628]
MRQRVRFRSNSHYRCGLLIVFAVAAKNLEQSEKEVKFYPFSYCFGAILH